MESGSALLKTRTPLLRLRRKLSTFVIWKPALARSFPGWSERCSRACYDCLLSYSNQLAHPLIDRHLTRDFLLLLLESTTTKKTERSRDEQYTWLEERRDHNSSLEREFLKLLHETEIRGCQIALSTALSRRSTRKQIFTMSATECRGLCVLRRSRP